jgi:hypothetical protein
VTVTGVPAPKYTVTGLPLGGNGSLRWYEEGRYFVIYGSTCPVGTVLGPVTLRVSNGINPDAIQTFSVTITSAEQRVLTIRSQYSGTDIPGLEYLLDGLIPAKPVGDGSFRFSTTSTESHSIVIRTGLPSVWAPLGIDN